MRGEIHKQLEENEKKFYDELFSTMNSQTLLEENRVEKRQNAYEVKEEGKTKKSEKDRMEKLKLSRIKKLKLWFTNMLIRKFEAWFNEDEIEEQ